MIFVISDIHTSKRRLRRHCSHIESRIERPLDEHDTVICLGDLFGLSSRKAPSRTSKLAADRRFIKYIETLPFNIVCIYGNHDNEKRVYRLSSHDDERFGGHVRKLGENIFYLDNGQIYDIPIDAGNPSTESVSVLALGGAFGHLYRFYGASKVSEQAFYKQYLPLVFAIDPIKVDYVLSHDAPTSKMGRLARSVFGSTPASDILDSIKDNVIFHEWYFGHHHLDLEPSAHFHGLYRREVELSIPEENAKRVNEQLIFVADYDGAPGSDSGDCVDCVDNSNPSHHTIYEDVDKDNFYYEEQEIETEKEENDMTLTEMMIAMASTENVEDRIASGQVPTPRIPSDKEIELLVACMKEDAKIKKEENESEDITADR